ncbi:alpha/beta hydrolase [Mycobacterium montefiorense]|uniref:Alpha/beta hydrolase n=1 Tax=Mycobacterium montefiorense TaxID=154654 RepID=A0AA37UT50_9MYCO|nr:alpha/beta fold hydrolase [Mycobacterium montefiorense]GBG35873.1 alpha/beta hydrolase [Mycobacterium montefiorense]GKU35377.1 alpha/beta hydrolase [Mycobacterium montefiorense]GKU40378.1 alpha/beta hydrolase [Mycobacterium montefiorense]GKU45756.1 alpha/beta hydrolase [Mycobacterium montefiorense]GKU50112.1 alpha/beta hydrolase [Mycobacterium montefiorense]
MTAAYDTTRVSFMSRGNRCAAWLTLPDGPGPHPGLVLAHGLGATHGMSLSGYEQHFARSGVATLVFDYRYTGESDGEPRQQFSMRGRQDVAAACDYLRGHADIDAARLGLWGTSLGAMHVLQAAEHGLDVAAVVVQCPIVHGPGTLLRSGLLPALRLTPAIVADAIGRIRRMGRTYVPIVGEPGGLAAVTGAGALDGWYSTVSPGCTFDNRMAAMDVLGIASSSAKRGAAKIKVPLLVCVSRRETLMDPRHAEDVAAAAPRGIARHYDGDHFQIYHPPLRSELLADQTAFLQEHLGVRVG